jgi:hypothetical protein
MLTAFFASCAFLFCYLVYLAQVGSVPFPGQGLVRTIRVPVPAIMTFRRGLTGRLDTGVVTTSPHLSLDVHVAYALYSCVPRRDSTLACK